MVTLKNNFGVEPDKDSVVMNLPEGAPNDAKSSATGHPKAFLICRRNSNPFQARTLTLNTPAKIGRSVARARPSKYNGIFDCKVLSRNHAVIWYEYGTGKFMIQDTKSSNGTFVNNQRLSKAGETSAPKEFFSRDVVQFGVDVLENQRKGNEESENSDESNRIVTHGCIVATVRLFHPDGKESESGQPYSAPNPMTPIPQEKIYKLELIIQEAQQREERLHDKLEELQLIISKLEIACQEALTNRFEETRLLSKIESLEKQTRVMSKMMSGSGKTSEKVESEIQQLLVDIEKVQSVAREIQERQHRKLLESEQKLVEAQRVASNLELEVIALQKQASLSESHLEEMGSKCMSYCQTIEALKTNLQTQVELSQKLEARIAEFEEREAERDLQMCFSDYNIMDKYKFITAESEEGIVKNDSENHEVILEWCKNSEESDKIEEKDFINEDDKTEWLTKKLDNVASAMCCGLEHISSCIEQLENSLMEVERSKRNLEKLFVQKHELALQLEAAKMPVEENEKTENDLDGEKHEVVKPVILTSLSNEKVTELENELKEQEELLNEERQKQKESEGKCTKLRSELDATIKRCEKLNVQFCSLKSLLRNHMRSMEDSSTMYRQKIVKLESEKEALENAHDQKLLDVLRDRNKIVEGKETQTTSVEMVTASTNTDSPKAEPEVDLKEDVVDSKSRLVSEEITSRTASSSEAVTNSNETLDNSAVNNSVEDNKVAKNFDSDSRFEDSGAWEKIQKMQGLFSSCESSLSNAQVTEMRNLTNLIAEDLVHLLLRERQISKDKECLQEKLNKTLSREEASAFGLAMRVRTIMLISITAVVAYFLSTTLS